jgi:hypothetical protein
MWASCGLWVQALSSADRGAVPTQPQNFPKAIGRGFPPSRVTAPSHLTARVSRELLSSG